MYSIDNINSTADKIFDLIGYPDKKNEFWKYTSLKKFKSLKFTKPLKFDINFDSLITYNGLSIPTVTICNGKVIT